MTLERNRAAAPQGVPLSEVARAVGAQDLVFGANVDGLRVRGVRQDSRGVSTGELFAVRRDLRTSGWVHLPDALARGAVAVMADTAAPGGALPVPLLVVDDVRAAIAKAANLIYGDPTHKLAVVGITGTNGKTTTSYLVSAALEGCGFRPGLIGTVGYRFESLVLPAAHTTPESDEIARTAASMAELGASHLVMEVSSHALALGRVQGVHFKVAAFTNLSQDHLDFHGDMQAYGETKARLFLELLPERAVINIDDPFGAALAQRLSSPAITVSTRHGAKADLAPLSLDLDARRTKATVRTPVGEVKLEASLIGAHNFANIMLALGVCHALGLDLEAAARALRHSTVPGRLERCDGPEDDLVVVVDYAHTPDALDRVLAALTSLREAHEGPSRLICVFGCGGDRDASKRAPMGRAVAKWADIAVVTTDNARSESPRAIADDILPGLEGTRAVVVELDRERAIHDAIRSARSGDVVLIAGKGHETYQIVGSTTRHFDDREHARAALAARRAVAKDAG
jgi:UDP-N-acetylmuramoyl-L-alanyl-D-glutamate--2,6-diaminopimelate ligase